MSNIYIYIYVYLVLSLSLFLSFSLSLSLSLSLSIYISVYVHVYVCIPFCFAKEAWGGFRVGFRSLESGLAVLGCSFLRLRRFDGFKGYWLQYKGLKNYQ